MNKMYIILVIIIGVLLAGGYWLYKHKQPISTGNVQIQTFSCPGIEGFTFEYPVFKGWGVDKVKNVSAEYQSGGACLVLFRYPKDYPLTEIAPQIKITVFPHETEGRDMLPGTTKITNLHGVKYLYPYLSQAGPSFWINEADDDLVNVELLGVVKGYGFDENLFFKTVNNSFRLTNTTESQKAGDNQESFSLKAYSLSYATFNPLADHPDFKHVLYTGSSWTTLIVPLKGYANIKDDTYLITKFSHPVLPNAVPESVAGSTYMYSVKDKKATPWPGDLKYENGALDARMAWGGAQGQNVSMIIKVPPENEISIKRINEFEQITKLPGFEQATYREVKNVDAP